MEKLGPEGSGSISGPECRRIIPFVAMGITLLLAGCQARVKQGAPPAVSLEEAKKITTTFEPSFTPPPRTITDITALLAQEKRQDPESYRRSLALVDRSPPTTNDPRKLADFYLNRARAAHDVGRTRQGILSSWRK